MLPCALPNYPGRPQGGPYKNYGQGLKEALWSVMVFVSTERFCKLWKTRPRMWRLGLLVATLILTIFGDIKNLVCRNLLQPWRPKPTFWGNLAEGPQTPHHKPLNPKPPKPQTSKPEAQNPKPKAPKPQAPKP